MDFKADIHIHTNFSDGIYSPNDILKFAKKENLSAISITDHDTIKAYDQTLFLKAKELNIKLITGIEISSMLFLQSVHILGYNFDYQSKTLHDFLKKLKEKRNNRNKLILEKLRKFNIVINYEELIEKTNSDVIGRVHIAKKMMEKDYVSSLPEAFNKYLKDGGPCFISTERVTPIEIIEVLKKVNAKIILAHPHQIKNQKILNLLFDMPFDGIEAFYNKTFFFPEKTLRKKMEEKNWILTGGSDFHGFLNSSIKLGFSYTNLENFERLCN